MAERKSCLDLDSTVVTVFGHQEQAEVGYNPRYRGKRSYNPLLCLEANSSLLWDAELRAGNAGSWDGSVELLADSIQGLPPEIRELRVRADAGFGYNPVLDILEARPAQYAVVARLTTGLKRKLAGLRYEQCNPVWQIAELEHRPYNLVTAFQRTCLPAEWQDLTLGTLRYRLFWLPGELTRPQNRPTLRLANSPAIQSWTDQILHRVHRLKPLED